MIGSAGARGPAERVTNGAGKQRETNCCGILRVLSRHTPIVSSPGGTGTLSIASRTFIPVYIYQATLLPSHTSNKAHFYQATLITSVHNPLSLASHGTHFKFMPDVYFELSASYFS